MGFKDTRYTIRYFQPDGKGKLRLEDDTLLSPNDRYWLPREEFRLYYTSLSYDQQTIDVYVEDNFGQKKELHFSFNGKSAEQHVDHPKPTRPTSQTERDA